MTRPDEHMATQTQTATRTAETCGLLVRSKGLEALHCVEGTFYPAESDDAAGPTAARKRLTRGTYRGKSGQPTPAVAIAFEPHDVATFGTEVAALAELQRIGAGPALLDVVRAEDVPDGRPTLIEEDAGASLEDVALGRTNIPGSADVRLADVGTHERELQNAKILLDVCQQIAHMHEAHRYHGDLKLSNICVRNVGARPRDLRATVIDIERRLDTPDATPPRLTPLYLDAMFVTLPRLLGLLKEEPGEPSEGYDRKSCAPRGTSCEQRCTQKGASPLGTSPGGTRPMAGGLPTVLEYDLACLEALRFELARGRRISQMDAAYATGRLVAGRGPKHAAALFAYDRNANPRIRHISRRQDLAPLARQLGLRLEGAQRRRILFARIALLVLVCVVTGIGLARLSMQPAATTEQQLPWVDDQPGRTIVTLQAQDDVPYASLKQAQAMLHERLDNAFGEDAYLMVADGDKAKLSLPTDAFGTSSVKDVLCSYFVRPMELYAYNGPERTPDYYTLERDSMQVARSQMRSLTLEADGTVAIGLEDDTYAQLASLAQESGELRLILDVSVVEPYSLWDVGFDDATHSLRIPPAEDPDDAKADELCGKALLFALERDPMPAYFEATVEPHVSWEAFDEDDLLGQNQVTAAAVGGDAATVTFTHGANFADALSEGLPMDARRVFVARLDAMDQPYALGESQDDAKSLVALLPAACAGESVAALLASQNALVRVRVGLEEFDVASTRLEMGIGGKRIVCGVAQAQAQSLREALGQAGDAPAYLAVAGYPLFFAESGDLLAELSPSGTTLTFAASDNCFDADSDADDMGIRAEDWLAELVDAVLNGSQMPFGLEVTATAMPRNDGISDEVVSLGVTYDAALDGLLEHVREVVPGATAYVNDRTANVYLHLDVDETLPEQCLSKVEDIYRRMDFQSSPFDTVSFVLCETRAGERASIHFGKDRGNMGLGTTPHAYVFGGFRGGRLERYRDDFAERFEASSFYQGLMDDTFSFFLLD